MEFRDSLNARINEMRSSKKKELWEQLRESKRAFTYIPPVYEVNERSKELTEFMKIHPIDSLKTTLDYYRIVQSVYNNYDFILTPLFYEGNIHVNEIDILYVSDKSRKQLDTMCNRLSKKIANSR